MEEDESSISVGSTGTLIALMGKEMQIIQARKSFGTYDEYLHYSYQYYSCSKSPSYSSSCQLAATRRHSLAGPDHQLAHLSSRYLSRPGDRTCSHVPQPAARHVRSSTSRADREESTVARSLSDLHVSTSPPPAPLANRHVTPNRSRASSAAAVGPTLGRHVTTSPPDLLSNGHVGADRSRANSAANGRRVSTSPPPTPLANGHVSPDRGRANSAAAHGHTIGRQVGIRVDCPNSPKGQSSPSLVSFITPSPRDTYKKKKKGHITIAHDDDDDDHSNAFTPMLASKIMDHPDGNDNNVGLNVVPRSLLGPLKFKCKSARSLSFVDVVDLKGCCPNRILMNGVLGCKTKQRNFSRLL